jgi:hypothetical protein
MWTMIRLAIARVVLLASAVATGLACGGDDHAEHEFDTYLECYQHFAVDEGVSEVGTMTECDGYFEVEHDDAADCATDHGADVGAGVPEAAVSAHCAAEFRA